MRKSTIGKGTKGKALIRCAIYTRKSSEDGEDNPRTFEPALWDNELTVTFTVPAHLKRVGMETRLLIEGADGSARKSPDRSLLRLLSQGPALPRNGAAQPGQDDDGACHRGRRRWVLLHPDPAAQLPRAGGREDHPPGPPSARADREEACRRHAPANRMGRTACPVRDRLSQGIGCCPTAAPG